jgi:hypothetical protein
MSRPTKSGSMVSQDNQISVDVESRQRNIVWPDLLRNNRYVEESMWRETKDAPLVQRVGFLIFAGLFAILGIGIVLMAFSSGLYLLAPVALVFWYLTARLIRNCFGSKQT